MFNHCTTIVQELRLENPEKQGRVLGNQLLMGTIALRPFVTYCVAFCELLRLNPQPYKNFKCHPTKTDSLIESAPSFGRTLDTEIFCLAHTS